MQSSGGPSHPAAGPEHREMWSRVLGLALLAAVAAAYWPSIPADFVAYDDPAYVSANPDVLRGFSWEEVRWAFTSLRESNWHPLTWLSLMLDSEIYGLFAPGYRITNLLLHWGNALLFLQLVFRLSGRFWPAALAAGLFALHPQHVESVAWVSERKDVLCAFFWLLSLLAYLEYARARRAVHYWLSLGIFALGCMAKQMVVTLPCVLLLLDYWPLSRFRDAGGLLGERGAALRRCLAEKLPFLALAGAACFMTLRAQNTAMAALTVIPLGARIGNAFESVVRYLGQTFWPVDLAVFYPHPQGHLRWFAATGAGLLVLALTLAAWGQARRRPYLLVGWLWFLGTLVPVIGLVQVGMQGMADRYMYIPHMGLFLVLALGADDLARGLRISPARARAAGVGLVLLLGVLTWRQAGYWKSTHALFSHAAQVTERNFLAHHMLALDAAGRNDGREFARQYGLAVSYSRAFVAEFHVKMGYALAAGGDRTGAVFQFVQAREISPGNYLALFNLAMVHVGQGRLDTAEQELMHIDAEAPGLRAVRKALETLRTDRAARARRLAELPVVVVREAPLAPGSGRE